jgi:hypothetical protein
MVLPQFKQVFVAESNIHLYASINGNLLEFCPNLMFSQRNTFINRVLKRLINSENFKFVAEITYDLSYTI